MPEFDVKSILLATDFRQASTKAADVAAHLAQAPGAQVNVLHVMDVVPADPLAVGQYREHALDLLRQVSSRLSEGGLVATALPIGVGSRADEILRVANELLADMIVIGAGELTPGEVFSVGAVAEAVIQHARQPVLAIRPGAEPTRFARILCPVDQSPAAREGLKTAIGLARMSGGAIVVLSVVPPLGRIEQGAIAPPHQLRVTEAAAKTLARAEVEQAARWRAEFARFLDGVEFGDVSWTQELRQGEPWQEIIAAARAHQADVIVMGATGRAAVQRLLIGSVTRHVLRQLPCALLAVRELGDARSPSV